MSKATKQQGMREEITAALNGRHAAGGTPNEARRGDVVTTWEDVTPELAARYRAKSARNRRVMPTLEASYGFDMGAGQWPVTHQGIAFNLRDELVDGQHRCGGIILSGVTVTMLVTRGLSDEAIEAIDRGRLRSLAHTMQILGYELADNRTVAMARSMWAGPDAMRGGERPTDTTVRKFMERHRDALVFARSLAGAHALPAGVTGVFCRAFAAGVRTADIERFARAMADDIAPEDVRPGDRSARTLAAFLSRARGAAGGSTRHVIYRKTQNALRYYLDGVDVKSLHEISDDLFPLPEPRPAAPSPPAAAGADA